MAFHLAIQDLWTHQLYGYYSQENGVTTVMDEATLVTAEQLPSVCVQIIMAGKLPVPYEFVQEVSDEICVV